MKNQPKFIPDESNYPAIAELLRVVRAWKERRLCHALIVTQDAEKK